MNQSARQRGLQNMVPNQPTISFFKNFFFGVGQLALSQKAFGCREQDRQ